MIRATPWCPCCAALLRYAHPHNSWKCAIHGSVMTGQMAVVVMDAEAEHQAAQRWARREQRRAGARERSAAGGAR